MLRALIALFLLVPAVASAGEVPSYVQKYVPSAKMVGKGRLTFMTFDVYDAALYAPQGRLSERQPFALSLTYLRPIQKRDIADRSIEELRRQGLDDEIGLASWHEKLLAIFPNVKPQTTITGIALPDGTTVFYQDGKSIGRVNDPAFTQHFFNIWLGPQSSEPSLRRQLLGGSS